MSKICVIGLGYVGLPLAVEFSKKHDTIGFDTSQDRIRELKQNYDRNGEVEEFGNVEYTTNGDDIADADVYIITVPTPVDERFKPDLDPLLIATKYAASYLQDGDYVIYESTVFPGCTEEVCKPLLDKAGVRYSLGYSPERINPGDKEHTVKNITKVVAGDSQETSGFIKTLYSSICDSVYVAESIKVAESAKLVENIQRDVNIALMNQLYFYFSQMGINAISVLNAAKTKWNFVDFKPGLVGGHCVSVDPYYLLHKTNQINNTGNPFCLIQNARNTNEDMPKYFAAKIHTFFYTRDYPINARILIAGYAFKPNVSDCRNTKVKDVIEALLKKDNSYKIDVYDPHVDFSKFDQDTVSYMNKLKDDEYDLVAILVDHDEFKYKNLYERGESVLDLRF